MPTYTCHVCLFSSKIKCNYLSHLKTKKHLKNIKEIEKNEFKIKNIPKATSKPKVSQRVSSPKMVPSNFNPVNFFHSIESLDKPAKYFSIDSSISVRF